jgi:hypothetical protein
MLMELSRVDGDRLRNTIFHLVPVTMGCRTMGMELLAVPELGSGAVEELESR